MKNQFFLLCTLIILLSSCEAHINVEPGSGKTFCDCTDVSFTWSATDQNGDPLNNVTINTPRGDEPQGSNGTYTERLCESHTYIVSATNRTASTSWPPIVYDKITEPREFPLEYTCDGFIPVLTDEQPSPDLMTDLRILRICNGYDHKSVTVSHDGWSLEIPAGGCVNTETLCESVDISRYQSWRIESGEIINPTITREDCDPRGETAPPPGVINPGNLRLRVLVACSCDG